MHGCNPGAEPEAGTGGAWKRFGFLCGRAPERDRQSSDLHITHQSTIAHLGRNRSIPSLATVSFPQLTKCVDKLLMDSAQGLRETILGVVTN
jgi:hypothetical protein